MCTHTAATAIHLRPKCMCRSQFSSSTLWAPGLKQLAGLVGSIFTCWAISTDLLFDRFLNAIWKMCKNLFLHQFVPGTHFFLDHISCLTQCLPCLHVGHKKVLKTESRGGSALTFFLAIYFAQISYLCYPNYLPVYFRCGFNTRITGKKTQKDWHLVFATP